MKFLVSGDISEAKKASKVHKLLFFTNIFIALRPFLTRELRACARASYRYDVGMAFARSLARSIGRFP